MALASTTVFESRPGAGSATNGGGFVPGSSGTDWSQQNAAQYALTNGSATTGNATVNTVSTVADMVGNIVYVAGGTGSIVGGWYQILSQITGVSITLDRSTGLVTGTGVTLNVGGALDSAVTAEPLLTAGMTLWIKAGTTTLATPIVLANSGDATSGPIMWNGYHTARGDHDGTQPLITSSTNSCDLLRGNPGGSPSMFRQWDNINWSSTAGTPGSGITAGTNANGSNWSISNCKISGCKVGINCENATYAAIINLNVINCEITGCTVDAVSTSAVTLIDGCYLHGNSGYGVRCPSLAVNTTGGSVVEVENSVIYNNSLGGIYVLVGASVSGTAAIWLDLSHSAIVGNTNDGVQNAVANTRFAMLAIENCILYGNSGYGVNVTNAAALVILNRNNAYGANTSGPRNNLAAGTNDVTLTADPFTARTGNDFSLNLTVGGGAACKAAGFPGSIPGLVTAGFADVGALQSKAGAGGGQILQSSIIQGICAL